MHHPDSEGDRGPRVVDGDRLAVDSDRPAIGLDQSIQDRHQRALASAVLANQTVNGTRCHRQGDVAIGVNGTKTLGDRTQLNGWNRVVH